MIRNKRNMYVAVIFVLFFLSFLFSSLLVFANSAIRYSSDFSEFLTSWKLTIGDKVYDQDTSETTIIEYKPDVLYNLVLSFEERRDLQFATDGQPLLFSLPEGFKLREDFSMMLNVNLGKWGTLANNPITYDNNTHSLILKWNTADEEHMKKFRDSASAVIKITLSGYLGGNESKIFGINSKEYSLRREDLHNAYVTKEGIYDPVSQKITYTVEVISDGTTSELTLTDTLGTALTYSGDVQFDSTSSVNTANTNPVITAKTGNTFSVHIPLMNDQDRLVFVYSASVDFDKIAHSGNASFEETGNTAQIFGDSYPADNKATYYESLIEFSDLVKNSVGVSSEYRSGVEYDNIKWQIITNKDCIYSLAGTTITDTISENIQDISAYYGDGVEILCYADDILEERRFITWEELGIDPLKDKSWTYSIPDTDQNYCYVFNYDTTVNMDGQNSSVVISNAVSGKGGIDSAYEVLSPSGGNLGVSKKATNITSDSVVWEIKIHLKDQAFDRQKLVLTEHQNSKIINGKVTWESDYLPYKWLDPNNEQKSRLYKETLDTLEISGLYDEETFVLNYGNHQHEAGTQRTLVAEDSWHSDEWTPEKLSIEFYKNPDKTQGGLNRPTDGSNSRTITVKLKTKFPEEWAQHAKQQNVSRMNHNTWYYEHLNWADVEGVYDVAKIAPYPVGVYKRVLRDASSYYSQNINIVQNGRVYPVYYYQVLVSGVESDSPLVIDDLFDTSIFKLYEPHSDQQMSENDYLNGGIAHTWDNWYYTKYGGISEYDWLKPELGTCVRFDEDPEHILTQEETEYGIRFIFNKIPKDQNNHYYKFYGVEYWLTAKDENALRKIEDMASASETGEAVFTNTADCRGETDTVRVLLKNKNDFSPIEKNSEPFIEYTDGTISTSKDKQNKDISRYGLNYRIDLNKEKAELNEGKEIVAEDRYSSNLSVDFQTIQIKTDPPDRKVSYDYSKNVGRFTIPDRTHVIIEYQATIISSEINGVVSVENTVTMLNDSKTKKDEVNYAGSCSASASNPSIMIKKYEREHMESGLNGAVFQLYRYKTGATGNTENDWEPMVYADEYSPTGEGRIPNPNKGKEITFTTCNLTISGKNYGDGYANIELTDTEHGLNMEYDTIYGLREIQTPVRTADNGEIVQYQNPHQATFFCYQFTICQRPEETDYSHYIYRPDETLTVKNDPQSISLRLTKKIDGNSVLSEEEKNQLYYQVYCKQKIGTEEKYMPVMTTEKQNGTDIQVIDPHFDHITYQEITTEEDYVLEGLKSGEYLLAEKGNDTLLALHPDWSWTGNYEWQNGGTGNFSKIPCLVYDANGENPEQVYGVEFQITAEDIKENEQKSLILTNQYTTETVDLTVAKKWLSPDYSSVEWPMGKKVKIELGRIENDQFVKIEEVPEIELDNKVDLHGEEKAGMAVFHNLPKYAQGTKDKLIPYAVREMTAIDGYRIVYPENEKAYAIFGTGTSVTIKNQAEAVSVRVAKKWQTSDGVISPGAKAVLRLYAYTGTDISKAAWVNTANDIELDGIPDEYGEISAWSAVFQNLPQYDSRGALLTYIVKEQSCFPIGFSTVESYATNNGILTNSPAVTSFFVTKQWKNTENNTWPENAEITFILKRKTKSGYEDRDFEAVYRLKKSEIVFQSDIRDWSGKPIMVSWNGSVLKLDGLQKISDSGEEWLYYLLESPIENYDMIYKNEKGYYMQGFTYSGGSVLNVRVGYDLIVQKKVSGSFGNLAEQFDFTVKLMKDDHQPYQKAIEFVKTNADGTEIQDFLLLSDEGGASFQLSHHEKIRFKNIPAGIYYTVEEVSNADGYITNICVNQAKSLEQCSISGSITGETLLLFENKREGIVPTGVSVTSGMILILPAGMILGLYLVRRKR